MTGYWNAHSDLDWYGRTDAGPEPCRDCGGDGWRCMGEGDTERWLACPRCGGEGSEP
jgi:DnaJ-class molecular chaperone